MNSITLGTSRIRELNDAFRKGGPLSGRWILTQGVLAQGPAFLAIALNAVQSFDNFTPDNDPHREHDFGAITVGQERLFWKIDYYDRTLRFGSERPDDETMTVRVLTLMLASEY